MKETVVLNSNSSCIYAAAHIVSSNAKQIWMLSSNRHDFDTVNDKTNGNCYDWLTSSALIEKNKINS